MRESSFSELELQEDIKKLQVEVEDFLSFFHDVFIMLLLESR